MESVYTDGSSLFAAVTSGSEKRYGRHTVIENVRLAPWEVRMGADSLPVVLLVLYGRVDISVNGAERVPAGAGTVVLLPACLLYTSDAADEL